MSLCTRTRERASNALEDALFVGFELHPGDLQDSPSSGCEIGQLRLVALPLDIAAMHGSTVQLDSESNARVGEVDLRQAATFLYDVVVLAWSWQPRLPEGDPEPSLERAVESQCVCGALVDESLDCTGSGASATAQSTRVTAHHADI
jgi:hypothetical protein